VPAARADRPLSGQLADLCQTAGDAPSPDVNPETIAPPSLTRSGLFFEKGTFIVRLEGDEGRSLRIVSVTTAMI
jgi:hypothetical protein